MYEVATDAPPPAPQELIRDKGGAMFKYPFHTLDVGASFFVPYEGATQKALGRRIAQAIREARSRVNQPVPITHQFVWAERSHKGKKGLRVWRTS